MTAAGLARFAGRTALLTAAATGIGAATAHRLAGEGASVLVTDVDGEGARQVAEEVRAKGGNALHRRLDATSPDDWAGAVAAAEAWTGRLDVLHCNAGGHRPQPLHEVDDDSWHAQLRLSLDSVFFGIRAAVPLLRAARGAVVVTSSVHALIGFKGFPAYAAAKGGIGALVRQLAAEHGGEIRFNAVLPGAIDTVAWANVPAQARERAVSWIPVGRLGVSDDIAAAVAYLASDDASFVTGQSLVVDGGRSISAHE